MSNKIYSSTIVIVSAILFLASGLASSYLFHLSEEGIQKNALFPGLIFTSTTILVFIIFKTDFSLKNLLLYYALMYFTYLAVYYVTYFSVWVGFLTGIFTGGFGAVATFVWTNELVVKIAFKKKTVFILGGLAFLMNDILLIDPIPKLIEPVYIIEGGIHTIYAATFLFWQVIVGTKLAMALHKKLPAKAA